LLAVNMSNVNTTEDADSTMPLQSLILLASHRPVFETIIKHLPRESRKILRLTCSQMKDIIPLFDASFNLWKIDFGQADEFPSYFFRCDTPIKLIFPRVREIHDVEAFKNFQGPKMIEIPWQYDVMMEITRDIRHRVIALEIDLEILSRYKKDLQFVNLHSLEMIGCKSEKAWLLREQQNGDFQDVISLITNNCSSLTSLKLSLFQIPEDAEISVELPMMEDFKLVECCGGAQFAVSVVQKCVKHVVLQNNVQHQISSIKKLRVETGAFYRYNNNSDIILRLLTSVPNVEELHLRYLILGREANVTVSLPHLRVLNTDKCRGIIPAVIQDAQQLQEIAGEQEEVSSIPPELHNNLRKISILEPTVGRVSLTSATTAIFAASAATLQELGLSGLIIEDCFKNAQHLDALVKLSLSGITGNSCSLLKICPNLEDVTFSFFFEEIEEEILLPSVKKLTLLGTGCEMGCLLMPFPCVEQLHIEGSTFFFREENFSLSCLTKLTLRKIGYMSEEVNLLEAKVPANIKIEDCMEDCHNLDAYNYK